MLKIKVNNWVTRNKQMQLIYNTTQQIKTYCNNDAFKLRFVGYKDF